MSETENKIQEAKDHTHVGDECLVKGVGQYGTDDLRQVRILQTDGSQWGHTMALVPRPSLSL